MEGSTWAKPATPGHQYSISTPQGCSHNKESRDGELTGGGDERGQLRSLAPKSQIQAARWRQPEIELGLMTTRMRGRSWSRERREGATGAPSSPKSSAGGNGGCRCGGAGSLLELGGGEWELEGV